MTRPPARLIVAGVCALLAFAALAALGTWQLHRRTWKLALIAQVETRVHAAPVAAPGPAAWRAIDAPHDAYRRVRAAGVFLPRHDTLVQAATDLGAGWWVMTPLRTDAGFLVLVNRGFVPSRDAPRPLPPGGTIVIGLLRLPEPGGAFLRTNDPAANRWYSRDVAAIATANGLGRVAPYLIDADAASAPPGGPVGGLTVVRFVNNHLSYALTWYALALMVAGGFALLVRATWHAPGDARKVTR